MTQEHRELLFKDLCARLPYDVKVQYMNNIFVIDYISSYEEVKLDMTDNYTIDISEVKPYLFPISSMTEEQRLEIEILTNGTIGISQDSLWDFTGYSELSLSTTLELIQWLYENHFDIYGLIPMGLAIDATNKNIY